MADYRTAIDALYRDARSRGHQYGFLLLRVSSIEYFGEGDPLILLYATLESGTATQGEVDACKDFWAYFVNLAGVAAGRQYNPYPFLPTADQASYVDAAVSMLDEELRSIISTVRDHDVFVELAKYLLDGYKAALNEFFSVNPRYMLDPYFTVTEFYANDEGVGLKAHHSNASSSTFLRTDRDAQSVNMAFDSSVGFFMGDMTNPRREWLVNGEPMYKTKFHGKYNHDGEWRPIVYIGDSRIAEGAALNFSQDEQAQGVFFYMYTTGFPVVEFILKTKVKLPRQKTLLKNGVSFFRLDTENDQLRNEYVYDGWLRFDDLTEQGVLGAIDTVRLAVQSLTFAFEVETTWQLKYRLHDHSRGALTPNIKDVQQMVSIVEHVEVSKDKDSLMAAISWFNLGGKSEDPIIAFVCFYTAIEAVARQLSEGKLDVSKFYKVKPANLTDQQKLAQYDELYAALYPTKLMELLRVGYFDIHETLTQSMKNAFAAIYGEDHAVYKAMFNHKDGLVGLRGSIVHESYSEWDREQYEIARNNLHAIRDIAHGFIARLALQIPKGHRRTHMSGKFRFGIDASRPGGTLVVSDLALLPNKDWKIKPEWI